jgi:hypothetical protein
MEINWEVPAIAIPAVISMGTAIATQVSKDAQLAARYIYGGAIIWFGGVGFMWLVHSPVSLTWRVLWGLLIGIGVFVGGPLLMRTVWPPAIADRHTDGDSEMPSSPPDRPRSDPTTGPITQTNQNGPNIGQQNNFYFAPTPRRLEFTEALGLELLAGIPKNKPVHVIAFGSNSDQMIGVQIVNFPVLWRKRKNISLKKSRFCPTFSGDLTE